MIVNSVNYSSGGELDYIPITTYADLISAMATSNAKPLRIMNDLTATAMISTSATNTLDLHGHTITGTNSFRFMKINTGGNVTLCDLAVDGGGAITTFKENDIMTGGGCVYISSNATFSFTGGTITNCSSNGGGGVDNGGIFNMSGDATITHCDAVHTGGGVYCDNGVFNMSGNAQISYCTAGGVAGGVFNCDGEFTMTGNASISYCSSDEGGGVNNYYYNTIPIFEMSGNANITHCNSTYGGGVYNYGTFNLTGGKITNCESSSEGGGIHMNTSRLNIGGTAIVQNNLKGTATNNVHNNSGTISLASDFIGNIGISYPTPSAGGTIGKATAGVTGAENIHADSTRTLIGVVDGTSLKWQKAT